MPNNSNDFYQNSEGLKLSTSLLILPAAYLIYNFVNFLSCYRGGQLSCNIYDLAVVFPLYAVVTSFFGRINFFTYILLYLLSSAVYLIIFYHFGVWLESAYQRQKQRPNFTLKRV